MIMIFTEDTKVPLALKYNYKILKPDISVFDKGMFNHEIWFDVSYLLKDTYKQLKNFINIEKANINFYIVEHNPLPDYFIFEKVTVFKESDTENIKPEIETTTDTSFLLENSTLVVCPPNANRHDIVESLIKTLIPKECSIEIISEKGHYSKYGASHLTISQIADKLENFRKDMMDRFKLMEKYGVNNITKFPCYSKKIMIIDNLDELLLSANYSCIDRIKSSLGSLARLSRAAGTYIIAVCSATILDAIIPRDFLMNMKNIIMKDEAPATICLLRTLDSLIPEISITNIGSSLLLLSNNEYKKLII